MNVNHDIPSTRAHGRARPIPMVRSFMSLRPALLAATAGCVLAAVTAPAAFAGSASVTATRLSYTASPGETNNVTISLSGSDYTISDSGASVAAGPGCTAAGGKATCPASAINLLIVDTGDLDDTATNTTGTASRPTARRSTARPTRRPRRPRLPPRRRRRAGRPRPRPRPP